MESHCYTPLPLKRYRSNAETSRANLLFSPVTSKCSETVPSITMAGPIHRLFLQPGYRPPTVTSDRQARERVREMGLVAAAGELCLLGKNSHSLRQPANRSEAPSCTFRLQLHKIAGLSDEMSRLHASSVSTAWRSTALSIHDWGTTADNMQSRPGAIRFRLREHGPDLHPQV